MYHTPNRRTFMEEHRVGSTVVFQSKYGGSKHDGQEARVIRRINGGRGTVYVIEFSDGHRMTAYPEELVTPK